jgi:hypothetical protein
VIPNPVDASNINQKFLLNKMASVVQQPSDSAFAMGEHPYVISAQQNFADQYAHEQPSQAISAYSR